MLHGEYENHLKLSINENYILRNQYEFYINC